MLEGRLRCSLEQVIRLAGLAVQGKVHEGPCSLCDGHVDDVSERKGMLRFRCKVSHSKNAKLAICGGRVGHFFKL